MGISEGAFWNMNITRLHPYVLAEDIRRENRDYDAWLHGLYVARAIESTIGNAFSSERVEYPEAPYLSKKAKHTDEPTEEERETERLRLVAHLNSVMAAMKAKEAREHG